MLFFDELFHIGTPQRFDGDPKGSGRFRKGSGENPHQHGTGSYYDRIKELHDLGMPYSQICNEMGMTNKQIISVLHDSGVPYSKIGREMGMTTTQIAHELEISSGKLRATISIEKEEREAAERARCLELLDAGYNKSQISEITGIKPSTVALRLKPVDE